MEDREILEQATTEGLPVEAESEAGVPVKAEPGAELKPGQYRVQVVDLTDKVRTKPGGPGKLHSFHFEYHSKTDKKVFAGNITVKRLNLGETAKVETEIARRNAGIDRTEPIRFVNDQLVTLSAQIVEGPEWAMHLADNDDLHDWMLLARLREVIQEWESTFR